MSNQEDRKIAAVIAAEREWLEAHLKLDGDALRCLMADEYTQVRSDGALVDKQQALESLLSGDRHWDAADSDSYRVQVYGDLALVYGRWRARGINSGHAFDYAARYVAVWALRDGRWQLVSDQSTEIVSG